VVFDDFGSGYDIMTELRGLPVDLIKLDARDGAQDWAGRGLPAGAEVAADREDGKGGQGEDRKIGRSEAKDG
jgi:hypothetical protein